LLAIRKLFSPRSEFQFIRQYRTRKEMTTSPFFPVQRNFYPTTKTQQKQKKEDIKLGKSE